MPRHTCPSTNRVAPAGYASVNFRGWKASITGFGKWQKKPSEQRLQERQSSTSSIPYGAFIATLGVAAQFAHCRSQWMKGDQLCSEGPTATGSRSIEGAYWFQRVQGWSILLSQQILVVASTGASSRSAALEATVSPFSSIQ